MALPRRCQFLFGRCILPAKKEIQVFF
jgi:hypothetical protein